MFNWLKKLFDNTEPEATGVRARNSKGHFVKDDASTPNVNEAYVDGKTPKRKPRKQLQRKSQPLKKHQLKLKLKEKQLLKNSICFKRGSLMLPFFVYWHQKPYK